MRKIAIIGAGIAGAGLAAALAERGAGVHLLEAEAVPGYHTTGRSAAFYAETYGGPLVQPLTTASRAFFQAPPPGFADAPLWTPRGALHVVRPGQEAELAAFAAQFPAVRLELASPARTAFLTPDWVGAALWEPDCCDLDVAALHQGFLRAAQRHGAVLHLATPVQRAERQGAQWRLFCGAQTLDVDAVVIAAGAWGDAVAALFGAGPLGLMPLRRTVVAAQLTGDPWPGEAPLVLDFNGALYFKPDAGAVWISPHDETLSPPCDAQPEELDVALAIDRFEQASGRHVAKIIRTWAGLRTFAPHRAPVVGFAADVPDLFWCVGQGGFGIQTAPALSVLAACVLLDAPLPSGLTDAGVVASAYAP